MVVVQPIGHRGPGKAPHGSVQRVEQGVGGHQAAVAPAVNADTGRISNAGETSAGYLVSPLGHAQLAINGGFEGVHAVPPRFSHCHTM